VSSPNEYNLRHNYGTLYKHEVGILKGKLRGANLKTLKCEMQRQQNIITLATKKMKW
jgi:hypothetical protein